MRSQVTNMLGLLLGMLMALAPAAALAVTTHVRITTPAGEPVESTYVVLDAAGETVARGTTDEEGEDRQDLPPGVYLFRSGDGEGRVTIREGDAAASVALTRTAPVSLGWGFDLGVGYGYVDHDGSLDGEFRVPGAMPGSDSLQLDGTIGELYGRVRFPLRLFGGQPFLQVGGTIDLSDASDEGGDAEPPDDFAELDEDLLLDPYFLALHPELLHPDGFAERAWMRLDLRGELALTGGLEWETPLRLCDRGIRVRPYAGLAFHWWSAELVTDGSALGMGRMRTDEEFTTTSGRLGVDVGVPLVDGHGFQLDFVLGGHYDAPFGGDERSLRIDDGDERPVLGAVDIDDSWGVRGGIELRWSPFAN